jgi:hypothetical protein
MTETFWTLKNHLDAFACFEDSASAVLWLGSTSSICAAAKDGTGIGKACLEEECNLVARLEHLMALTEHHVLPYLRLQERHGPSNQDLTDDTTAIAKYIALRVRHDTPDPDTASDVLARIDNRLVSFLPERET